jgi:hypothetical protein
VSRRNVEAQCRGDEDCAGDLKCAAWFTEPICVARQFYLCQTAADECVTSQDCAEGDCVLSDDGGRACVVRSLAVCGRPFLVHGTARHAEICGDSHWSASELVKAPSPQLGREIFERVGGYWARAALMEHASIAAFARFTLQLMHLGAPLDLIEASQDAMRDETYHARACFALAARYLQTPMGPGRLPMAGALEDTGLEQIVSLAFREGCVGETVATLEAREAAEAAGTPELRQVLTRIAADELRHSALAWKFVQWALGLGVPSVQRVLSAELARLTAEAERGPAIADSWGAPEHGVLSANRQATLRHLALVDVVLPCARQLLNDTLDSRSASSDPVSVAC